MRHFQLSQMHIVTVEIGGFVIGIGFGYALWKYPRDLFLGTVPETKLWGSAGENIFSLH
jgi:hypothetical protein